MWHAVCWPSFGSNCHSCQVLRSATPAPLRQAANRNRTCVPHIPRAPSFTPLPCPAPPGNRNIWDPTGWIAGWLEWNVTYYLCAKVCSLASVFCSLPHCLAAGTACVSSCRKWHCCLGAPIPIERPTPTGGTPTPNPNAQDTPRGRLLLKDDARAVIDGTLFYRRVGRGGPCTCGHGCGGVRRANRWQPA